MRSAAGLILTPVAEIPRHPRTFKGSGLQELLEQTRRTTRRPGIAGTPAGGRAEGWSEIFHGKVSGAPAVRGGIAGEAGRTRGIVSLMLSNFSPL